MILIPTTSYNFDREAEFHYGLALTESRLALFPVDMNTTPVNHSDTKKVAEVTVILIQQE
jgi:hypothetical protein